MKKKCFSSVIQKCLLISLSIIFYTATTNIYAQIPKLCGPYKINQAAFDKALQYEKTSKALSSQHYLVRVYFHIITDNDGTNAAADIGQIKSEFNTLVSNYSVDNLCFLNAGLNYINNTFLNNNFNADTDPKTDFDAYQILGCINIFYMRTINGTNPSCGGNCGYGGIALGGIPGTFCLIASGNIAQGQSISHEVGHCMGLLHTFEPNNGYEDIDGSNSATTGDQIVDTHADPYAFKKQSCFSTFGSVYTGNCTDPKGQTNYDPPYTNLMAYWWAYGYINLFNTADQFTRINSFLNTNTDLQACESPDNVTFGPVNYSSGYVMTSAVNSFTTSGSVNLSGTTIATLGGQTVFLENGFSAIPSNGGFISIEPSSCNYTFNKLFANNSTSINLNNEKANEFKLMAYPNPTSSIVHLDFATAKDENNVVVQVYNAEMKQVKEIRLGNLIKGKQSATINLNNLASGMYFITMQMQSEKLVTKVSLSK